MKHNNFKNKFINHKEKEKAVRFIFDIYLHIKNNHKEKIQKTESIYMKMLNSLDEDEKLIIKNDFMKNRNSKEWFNRYWEKDKYKNIYNRTIESFYYLFYD